MIRSFLRGLFRDDEAATAAEYATMLALVIFAVISAVTAVGNSTAGNWNRNVSAITNATSSAGS